MTWPIALVVRMLSETSCGIERSGGLAACQTDTEFIVGGTFWALGAFQAIRLLQLIMTLNFLSRGSC